MFDWENAIALHAMQGNRASSRGEGDVSCVFLELQHAPGVYSRVTTWMPILNGNLFSEVRHLSKYDGHLGKLN